MTGPLKVETIPAAAIIPLAALWHDGWHEAHDHLGRHPMPRPAPEDVSRIDFAVSTRPDEWSGWKIVRSDSA